MFWIFLVVAVVASLTVLSTVARTTDVTERLLATYATLLSVARAPAVDPEERAEKRRGE